MAEQTGTPFQLVPCKHGSPMADSQPYPWHPACEHVSQFQAQQQVTIERLARELAEAVQWIRTVGEELVVAKFPGGDRDTTLRGIRVILKGQEIEAQRLRAALSRLKLAAEAYEAVQDDAPHPSCGNTQPITVEDGNALIAALREAEQALGGPTTEAP